MDVKQRVTRRTWRRHRRFDLRRFDPAYFRRLRNRVLAAKARGIYVSVMLFEGWGLQWQGDWRWRSHPFHAPNNVNGIEGDANDDGSGLEAAGIVTGSSAGKMPL